MATDPYEPPPNSFEALGIDGVIAQIEGTGNKYREAAPEMYEQIEDLVRRSCVSVGVDMSNRDILRGCVVFHGFYTSLCQDLTPGKRLSLAMAGLSEQVLMGMTLTVLMELGNDMVAPLDTSSTMDAIDELLAEANGKEEE